MAVDALRAHKLRSYLTLLGIVLAVATLVSVMSVVNGLLVAPSESVPMRALRQQIAVAAPTNGRILIYGESGTGKELVARSLHQNSPRAALPFVDLNCAAIPEELIESELFGHTKGAFTGATQAKRGKFEQADGGTLLLDEVSDMSLKVQAKVLRVLEEQRFEPVHLGAFLQERNRLLAVG